MRGELVALKVFQVIRVCPDTELKIKNVSVPADSKLHIAVQLGLAPVA
jgi:hypothetical protein